MFGLKFRKPVPSTKHYHQFRPSTEPTIFKDGGEVDLNVHVESEELCVNNCGLSMKQIMQRLVVEGKLKGAPACFQ